MDRPVLLLCDYTLLRGKEMVYVASPYSHPDPQIRQRRYELLQYAMVELKVEGVNAVSPILHWHPTATRYNLGKDNGTYMRFNTHLLRCCDLVAVLRIPGHEESEGVKWEVEMATSLRVPSMDLEVDQGNVVMENYREWVRFCNKEKQDGGVSHVWKAWTQSEEE